MSVHPIAVKNYKEFDETVHTAEKNNAITRLIDKDTSTHSFFASFHDLAMSAGWWHDNKTGAPLQRNVPEMLCLIHSEISEAMEGYRKDKMDDHLPNRKSIEVELADAVIRIADLAGGLGLDLVGAMIEKAKYNATRADHKVENRLKDGGKAF